MSFKTILVAIVLVAAIVVGVAWYFAGQEPGPVLQLRRPGPTIGRQVTVEFAATAPRGRIKTLEAVLEQNGQTIPLVSLASPADAAFTQETPERMRVVRTMPAAALSALKDGPARIQITATRPVLYGFREAQTRVSFPLTVRLRKPALSVVSTGHRLNLGGAEVILYRVTPPDVVSGVQVGDLFYPGFPASGAGLKTRSLVEDRLLRAALRPGRQDADAVGGAR